MESILLIALVASNIYLIKKLLCRPSEKPDPSPPVTPPKEPETDEEDDDSICGKSHVDMEHINALYAARMKALEDKVHEVEEKFTRIETEMTRPEDVGLPTEQPNPQIPDDKLEETFKHHTVLESIGEAPTPHEPVTDGEDFNSLESTVRVLKDMPHTEEEEASAKEVIAGLEGTAIVEQLSLDPKVRTKLLTIMFGEENEPLNNQVIGKKKIAYSATIDTSDCDLINLNILT